MNSKTKTMTVRIEIDVADEIEGLALFEGVSRSEIAERAFKSYLDDFVLDEISREHGISREAIVKNVKYLFDSGKISVKDGKVNWNPRAMTDEYFTLDEKIDAMKISEREKDRIKREIAKRLDYYVVQDDTGNGAGL